MPLSRLNFAPGVNKEGTQYSSEGTWFDSDKVRFNKLFPEIIGGWQKYLTTTFRGVCRSLFDWVSASSGQYLGVGTNLKFYVNQGASFYDITPIRNTETLGTDPFAVVSGSTTVTVTDVAHGAVVNDFVTFSGATGPIGGIDAGEFNQERQITSIIDADSYTVEVETAATGTASGGGASVEAAYQINVGLNTYVSSTGWGSGTWSAGGWGSSSAIGAGNQLRLWSQDAFGDDLIFCPRGGGVYRWDESSGTSIRAIALSDIGGASNAPTSALQVMVSDIDRHVICFGANPIGSGAIDPLFVRWSDQESITDWTPLATNTAGGQRLSTGSLIIGALQTRQETLIWTDAGIESMRFAGAPFVFQFSVVARGISMISPQAAVSANGMVFFMDRGDFYVYAGSVQSLPCTVKDFVFSGLNLQQSYKVFAAANPDFNEVTWFYPVGTENTEVSRYVTYNYADKAWTVGTFDRTAWIDAPSRRFPIAAGVNGDDNNYLYEQEVGNSADGSAIEAFIESGDIDLDDGDRFVFMRRMIPDFTFRGDGTPSVDVVVKGRNYPMKDATVRSTSTISSNSGEVYVSNRMRQAIIRIESNTDNFYWRMGSLRADMRPDGRR
jgi:hypothetical protein